MKFILTIFGVLFLLKSNSQTYINKDSFSNNSIQFRVMRTSLEYVNDSVYLPSQYVIYVTNLSREGKKDFKVLDKKEWMMYLQNPKTDWAANLLLYEIFKKEATVFKVIKNRSDWIKTYYDKDLEYWKNRLY